MIDKLMTAAQWVGIALVAVLVGGFLIQGTQTTYYEPTPTPTVTSTPSAEAVAAFRERAREYRAACDVVTTADGETLSYCP